MKILKKKWVKIVGIVFAVVVCICFILVFFSYRGVKNSILAEMGINYTIKMDSIRFKELDLSAIKELDNRDRSFRA